MDYPAYLVLIVIVCYFFPLKGTQEPGEIYLVHFTPSFVSTFPVQVFAYTCAQNVSLQQFSRPDEVLTTCYSCSRYIMRSTPTARRE